MRKADFPTYNKWNSQTLCNCNKLTVVGEKMNCDFTFLSEETVPPGVLQCPFQGDWEVYLADLTMKSLQDVMDRGATGQREDL
jgi:hypothetical protein